MNFPQVIVTIWTGLTVATVLLVTGLVAWAVRTRQFSNQNRARYLPLGEPPPDAPARTKKAEKKPKENLHA